MSNCLYITATESGSGKSAIALGVMEMLFRKTDRVGFFRPIVQDHGPDASEDADIRLMRSHFNLDIPLEYTYGMKQSEVDHLLALGKKGEIIEQILVKYNEAKKYSEFLLCEGTDFQSATAGAEFDINTMIIQNLSCPVLLVASAHQKSVEEVTLLTNLTLESLTSKGCDVIATIINRAHRADGEQIVEILKQSNFAKDQLLFTVPDEPVIGKPTVAEVAAALDADILYGEKQLYRHARSFTVAAMQLRNFLTRIEHGTLIITPGDRADIIVACLASISSASTENIAAIILTGGLKPEDPVWELIKGFSSMVPVLSVNADTFSTAVAVEKIQSDISPRDYRKITRALALFEQHIDIDRLGEKLIKTRSTIVTPKMFEFDLIQRARANKKHIVLPEGEEERILRAAEILLHREIVDLTLLGDEERIRAKITSLGLRINQVNIVDPMTSTHLDLYADTYFQLRKHKGLKEVTARDMVCDPSYFGTLMVYHGHVDGMVSGAVHSTAATIKPAFEIIKTRPDASSVSSVFFMCLEDKVLVYGDCAVNPDPNAELLAQIATSSAETAKMFGIDPKVALLSYSTGTSGKGKDVEKVREATQLLKRRHPDLAVDGPIQYDAAVEPIVARTKLPDSDVAGVANVLVFPDLNTGNNTYKAVQRSSGALAVGPVLQGLNKPVNDLSRGCLVADIVNTVAITAVQAGHQQK
ncbi:MAG: phosphate acetyltransferase [Desulfobacterales bacterium]|nr:phosphate acetyltransferase [Desulfobacterales bacterium]